MIGCSTGLVGAMAGYIVLLWDVADRHAVVAKLINDLSHLARPQTVLMLWLTEDSGVATMTTTHSGSWYIASKPTSYSAVGFVVALIGGTLLAGIADLLGQVGLAHLAGATPESVLRMIASAVIDPATITDDQQLLMIGAAVHFGIIMAMVLVYLIAAARIPIVNSTPEISIFGYGLILGLIMVWVVLPLRWPDRMPGTTPVDVIGPLLRHIFLVAAPIAMVAKLAARRH